MDSFREAYGRLRGFAGVKRLRLDKKPKSNRTKKTQRKQPDRLLETLTKPSFRDFFQAVGATFRVKGLTQSSTAVLP